MLFVGIGWDGDWRLSCGTPACALGWATAIPEFHDAGLAMQSTAYGTEFFYEHGGPSVSPFTAGAEFFGLTRRESDYLFTPATSWKAHKAGRHEMDWHDPVAAAEKFEEFVAERQAGREAELFE